MKKIFGLALGLVLTMSSFAQSSVTFNDATTGYDKATATAFHFSFAADLTLEHINQSSTYYVDYFSVVPTPAASGHDVVITLVDNNDMSRRIISRFYTTLGVNEINVNATTIPLDEFIGTYVLIGQ